MTETHLIYLGSEVPCAPSVFVLVPTLLCLLLRALVYEFTNFHQNE